MKGLPIFVLLLAGSILTAAPAPKLFADPVRAAKQGWQRVWPEPVNCGLDYKVKVHSWGLEILCRYTEHHDQLIPLYRYVSEQMRFRNPRTQLFE